MPNGEQAHVLIMEHIEGHTLDELRERYSEATASDKTEHLQRLPRVVRLIPHAPILKLK